MITNERRDECLCYLAESDESYARAKAYMIGLENQKNTILSTQQLDSDCKTVADSKADSYTSIAYSRWVDQFKNAVYDYEILKNKRSTAALVIELWRSEFSALKQGIVI